MSAHEVTPKHNIDNYSTWQPFTMAASSIPTRFIQPKAIAFAKAFFDAGKPVAAICHGPWTIIETGARGRRMTSGPSLKSDLKNAGADWMDDEAVVDKGLVTSRKPDDIPVFCKETIKLFSGASERCHTA